MKVRITTRRKIRTSTPPRKRSRWPGRIVRWILLGAAAMFVFFAVNLLLLRWVNPIFTTVQVQRRIEAILSGSDYQKRWKTVPLSRISPDLQHAVVAAEDARFFAHWGIDFVELNKIIVDQDLEDIDAARGGSTITQQLIKNLFFTTHRSVARKGLEFVLAPMAEILIPKERILELYLNVVEWGPGVYGAESAAQFHYRLPASQLNREQAARLAAVLPSPRRRKPAFMTRYSVDILHRMRQMGW